MLITTPCDKRQLLYLLCALGKQVRKAINDLSFKDAKYLQSPFHIVGVVVGTWHFWMDGMLVVNLQIQWQEWQQNPGVLVVARFS